MNWDESKPQWLAGWDMADGCQVTRKVFGDMWQCEIRMDSRWTHTMTYDCADMPIWSLLYGFLMTPMGEEKPCVSLDVVAENRTFWDCACIAERLFGDKG